MWYVVSFTVERYIAGKFKDLFTPSESGSESKNHQRISDKHQRKFSLSLPFTLGVSCHKKRLKVDLCT